jgi:molecular chaperone GrpE
MRSSPASEQQHQPGQPAADQPQAEQPQAEQPSAEAALQERVDDLDDRYRRALADLDNYRKRSARETERRVTEAQDAVTREWLEALDSIERALDNRADDDLRAVLEQMETILARLGVSRVGAQGERFDPSQHEAIAVVESGDAPDQSVLDVTRSGYRSGARTLRPAQVVVARAPASAD